MKPYIEAQLSEEQAGFRPNRSTVEQIFVWKQLAERFLETQNGEMVGIFIDFKKAFDRVWHLGMFRTLQHYNIPQKLTNLIKSLYNQAVSAVRIGSDISDWFRQTVGVWQGCILSPDIFNIFLENVLREALHEFEGGVSANGMKISSLRFADDITLLGITTEECQQQLNLINRASERFGLEISVPKTKSLLVTNNHHDINIVLNGNHIEQVDQFKYLGTLVDCNNECMTDIKSRIAQSLKATAKLQKLWSNPRINIETKLRLMNCLIMPILYYGSENWTLNQTTKCKLQACEMSCLRKVLNIRWYDYITNEEVARRAGIMNGNIITNIRKQQLQWLGKVLRMEDQRLPKNCLQAHHIDKRRRGRPRICWIESVLNKRLSLMQASSMAHDIKDWNNWLNNNCN